MNEDQEEEVPHKGRQHQNPVELGSCSSMVTIQGHSQAKEGEEEGAEDKGTETVVSGPRPDLSLEKKDGGMKETNIAQMNNPENKKISDRPIKIEITKQAQRLLDLAASIERDMALEEEAGRKRRYGLKIGPKVEGEEGWKRGDAYENDSERDKSSPTKIFRMDD